MFTLPDLQETAPRPILTATLPVSRPALTPDQLKARQKAEEAWYKPLTHKQRRFVAALYANGFDEAAAAEEADPALDAIEARKVGRKWMKLPSIIASIEAVHAYYMESTKVRFDDMIVELKAIAFSDISNFFDEDTGALPPAGDPRYKSVAEIAIMPTRWGRSIRVKQYDKLAAMEKLLKIYNPTNAPVANGEVAGTTVNVQTINIMPVPQGHYIPAPQLLDEPTIIDNVPQPRHALPSPEAHALAAE